MSDHTNYYVGVDPSITATGIVILDKNCNIIHYGIGKSNAKLDPFERVSNLVADCYDIIYTDSKLLSNGPCTLVFAYESFYGGYSKEAYMRGVLDVTFHNHILSCDKQIRPNPGQVKKFITGKGNVGKDILAVEVHKKWGIDYETFSDIKPNLVNNIIDAYILARMAHALHNKDYTKAQLTLVNSLT